MNTNPIVYLFYATILFIIADMLYGFLESRKIQRKLNEVIEHIKLGVKLENIIELITNLRSK